MIPWEDIQTAPWNARKTFDKAANQELVASIEQHGIQVPLIVRPRSQDGFAFEIVAGHRRFNAAAALDLAEVPCIVRELNDDQAREIGLIDNVQREDVPALEQAEAFNELLQRLGSVPAVAAKVGKEQAHVAKLLKLCTLTCWSRDALREKLITIDHALLLARLAADEQNEALKWTLDRNAGSKTSVDKVVTARIEHVRAQSEEKEDRYYAYKWEPESIVKLKGHIERETGEKLDRAPWPLEEDHLVPDAGSCLDCEKNTKANAPLFGDLAIDEPTCTDGECYKAKTTAFVQIKLREAGQDENSKPKKFVPRLSWKASGVKPATSFNDITATGAMTMSANPMKILKAGQWHEAKKGSCANVRPGITADWSDAGNRGYMDSAKKLRKPGETLQVCIAVGCKVHKKDYEGAKPKSAGGGSNSYDPKAEADRRVKAEATAREETKLRMAIATKALEGIRQIPAEALRQLVLAGVPSWGGEEKAANTLLPGLKKIVQTAKTDSAEFAKALAIASLERIHCGDGDVSWSRKNFIESVKRLGYDASKAWDKPKAAAKPVVKKPAKKAAKKPTKKKGGRK